MSGWTNKGKFSIFDSFFRATGTPANMFVALVTDATAPSTTTNVLSDLTEIAAGNGYTAGGISLNRDNVDFDVLTEDDANNLALIQVKDIAWTAAGGTLPSGGADARYAVLLDDNGVVANREVYAFWSLGSNRALANGETLTLADLQLDATE